MIDSHCHLNFKAFAADAPAVANAMARDRVDGVVVGTDLTTSRYAIDLAQTFPNLYASVGLHPIHVLDEAWDPIIMKELALEDRVVAIGEVGLDNYRLPEGVNRDQYLARQEVVFRDAIQLAKELDLPLIIHSRDAYDEIIGVLNDSAFGIRASALKGTVHCYMGNQNQAQQLLDLGFMLGFTGVITYSDVNAELLNVVKSMPAKRILIETDAPYLTPEPYRTEGKKNSGKIPRNLPQYVLEVAKKIAEVRNMKMMEVVELTEQNAKRLFKI